MEPEETFQCHFLDTLCTIPPGIRMATAFRTAW